MNENRFFLWTKIFIKTKTRDKIKCSQKNFMGEGGQFSWGKINPGKCLPGKLPPEVCPPSPKEKKKKKKRKLAPENIISWVKCKRKRRDEKKID